MIIMLCSHVATRSDIETGSKRSFSTRAGGFLRLDVWLVERFNNVERTLHKYGETRKSD